MVPNNSCVIPLNYLTVGYVIKSLLSNHFRCIIDIFLDMIALKILYKIYRLVNCRLFSDFTILCFEYVIIPPMGWNLFKNSIFYCIRLLRKGNYCWNQTIYYHEVLTFETVQGRKLYEEIGYLFFSNIEKTLDLNCCTVLFKGQLISESFPKILMKKFDEVLPKNLKSG